MVFDGVKPTWILRLDCNVDKKSPPQSLVKLRMGFGNSGRFLGWLGFSVFSVGSSTTCSVGFFEYLDFCSGCHDCR
ncbi:hypothetical protein LINPERPRIM_LOCUS4116, partial [Linum perenne]